MFNKKRLARAFRCAVIGLLLATGLEGFKLAVFPTLGARPSEFAALLICAFVAFVVSLGLLCKSADRSDENSHTILKSLPEIACIFDSAGRFKEWNSNLEAALGYSAEEIARITAFDTIAEGQQESVAQTIAATFSEGMAKVESVLVAKDGTRIPCLLTGVRIVLDSEPCVLGIAVDLTKIRQAAESQGRLAAIVDSSEDAIIGKNLDGFITSWNVGAEKMYGYTKAEAMGQNISFLLPPDKQPEGEAILERVRQGLAIGTLETQRVTKARSVIDVSVSISPIKDGDGRILGASTIARDISGRKRSEQQLRLQSAALEAAANGIVITDHTGRIVWANSAFTTLTGYSLDEALGKNPRLLKSGQQPPSYYAALWSTISKGKVWHGELINKRKDGTTYIEEMTITPLGRDAGNPADRYFIAIKQDITERKQAEDSLLFKNALLEAQAETTIDGILAVDEFDHIILANKQFGVQFEIPDELMATRDDHVLLRHAMDKVEAPDAFIERVKYLYSHRDEKSRDEFRLKNGKWFDRYSAPLADSTGQYRGRIWYFRDLTERKLAEEKIQFLAYFDALTGLPNRTLLHDRLTKALARTRRQRDHLAILYLDLDGFKNINDSLGHSMGDLLLQEVAGRLKTWGREQDTVARVGGDEFVLLLSGVKDVADAAVAARRLMDTMTAAPFEAKGHSLNVSCSVGVSIFPNHGGDPETLIKNADAAMYAAKSAGHSKCQFFAEEMQAEIEERLSLENGLRKAVAREELFLVYQPQMEIATGRIVGVEALIRWRHPELGLVPPDKFIRIAENSGLIIPIGEWVLRTACSQARQWQSDGLPAVTVAVNVSAVQFRQEAFCELVRKVLRETSLAPQYLELELTESLLLSNPDQMLSVVQELNDMGLTLAIDDFGTGYSSFNYLKQFRASKLKIDRTFIRDVALNSQDAPITAAIISMAKSLRLKVIAEGVENEQQMSFLRAHFCDEIQGYFFSKPLSADGCAEIMASNLSVSQLATGKSGHANVRMANAASAENPLLNREWR